MACKIQCNFENIKPDVSDAQLQDMQSEISAAHEMLVSKTGKGSEWLGWLDLPLESDRVINEISMLAEQMRKDTDTLVCIGIGGSYLGARAVIDTLQPDNGMKIVYAGNSIDSTALANILDSLNGKKFWVNVISKSGTTLEPALAFRIIRNFMKSNPAIQNPEQYIVATTDQEKGTLKPLADKRGYKTFVIPDNVGGRFSVFTPVGLLPIAASGVDIAELMRGAQDCAGAIQNADIFANDAYRYAATRTALYRQGKRVEILANFNPALHYISEWWKQLFGESEGKEHKGLFPASVDLTTDLHSLGQYIQDGERILLETFLIVERSPRQLTVPVDETNADQLNYLAGKTMDDINHKAYQGTAKAHRAGGVPNMTITLPELSAYTVGQLLFFFQKAVAISGYLLGINPFDQPGVEAYKQNMFDLLGKPKD